MFSPFLTANANPMHGRDTHGIRLNGIDDVLVRYTKCCNPLPGDEIIGFITRGRGVTVHNAKCATAIGTDPARRIEVAWGHGKEDLPTSGRPVRIRVLCVDKPGILADISKSISGEDVNIKTAQIRTTRDNKATGTFEVHVKNTQQLTYASSAPGVVAAARYYFGKGIKDLTLAEAAMIAGVVQALRPARHGRRESLHSYCLLVAVAWMSLAAVPSSSIVRCTTGADDGVSPCALGSAGGCSRSGARSTLCFRDSSGGPAPSSLPGRPSPGRLRRWTSRRSNGRSRQSTSGWRHLQRICARRGPRPFTWIGDRRRGETSG